MKKKIITLLLITFFFLLFIFFYLLLSNRDPSSLPSVLIDKQAPFTEAKLLFSEKKFTSSEEFGEETILVNFFATWCKPCHDEHKYINILSKEKKIKIIGINYKDKPSRAIEWLNKLGNPYTNILIDSKGSIGIDWGVYGIPETFIVNSKGFIKYRHTGPITSRNFKDFYSKIKKSEE